MCRFRRRMCLCTLASLLTSCLLVACPAGSQERRERTLDEATAEAIRRAEDGMYPPIGLDPADVREAFASITRMDDDEWAAAFMQSLAKQS